jgi:hypothetical protein
MKIFCKVQFKIETIFPYKSLYISFWQSSLKMSSFWRSIESKRKSTYFNIQSVLDTSLAGYGKMKTGHVGPHILRELIFWLFSPVVPQGFVFSCS